jgi:hypothetical protein
MSFPIPSQGSKRTQPDSSSGHPLAKRSRHEEGHEEKRHDDSVLPEHLKDFWPGGIPSGWNVTNTEGVHIVYTYMHLCITFPMSPDTALGLAMLFFSYFIRTGTNKVHSVYIVMTHFRKYGVSANDLQNHVSAAYIQANPSQYTFLIELGGEQQHILYILCHVVMFAIIDSFNGYANMSLFRNTIKLLFEFVHLYDGTTPRRHVFAAWDVITDGLRVIMDMNTTHPHIHILGAFMDIISTPIRENKRVYGVPVIIGSTVPEYVSFLCRKISHVTSIYAMMAKYGIQSKDKKRVVVQQALVDYIVRKLNEPNVLDFRERQFKLVAASIDIPAVIADMIWTYVGTSSAQHVEMVILFKILTLDHLRFFGHLLERE